MQSFWGGKGIGIVFILGAVLFAFYPVNAQQQSPGTLRGQVADELGGLIIGATVTATDASGVERTAASNNEGNYVFYGLPPGRYTVRVTAPNFAEYTNAAVHVGAGVANPLNIALSVQAEQTEVTVNAEPPVSTEPENNAGAVVLRGADLDALPDDPDDLADALQALAGPSAGLDGGQVFIDGFTGGRLPPKESIREIRINRNPFSAEYDRLGYGRVEILTKPGTDRFRGQGNLTFNDESLNSRNPFAPTRAPYQLRRYGGNVSGPIIAKRASFFVDIERREIDGNSVVRAVVLDSLLNITPFSQIMLEPTRRFTVSPRIDYQLNKTNTLVARYSYTQSSNSNIGVGDFNLPARAYNSSTSEHSVQLTETAIINQSVVNESRLQYIRERTSRVGNNTTPTIRVLDAFTGGGSQIGLSFNDQDHLELQNFTSWAAGPHSLKAGGRFRFVSLRDVSPQNFAGTFTFSGGVAPQLDANSRMVLDPATGLPVQMQITSIERYRRTLLLQGLGLPAGEIRTRGGGATQFSISGGNPEAKISQFDLGPFIQDDWRFRPNLTVSLGLRIETQDNIHNGLDFAPRIAFAWSPAAGSEGGGRPSSTVIRGGFGIFYNRFPENLSLQAARFNGLNQQQFVVSSALANGSAILDLYPNVPSLTALSGFAIRQTVRQVATDLRTPYTMQTAFSIEKQLPYKTVVSATFISARALHVLRARNINAPIPGTVKAGVPGSGSFPMGNIGNIFQYESSGRFNQNQLLISANNRLSRRFTVFLSYVLNKANSDTDGANTFPASQYDLGTEYGRSIVDIRHRFFMGGSITGPWGLRLNPFVTADSGRPFNITIGRDLNQDTLFTDRPALATDLSRSSVVTTRFGAFDLNPSPDQRIIPRNFGTSPGFFSANLRVSRTFGFGPDAVVAAGRRRKGNGGRGGAGNGGGGGGSRGGNGEDGADTPKRYNLTLSVNALNIFNQTNLAAPVGNLSSPLFGQSVSTSGGFGGGANATAGNRRIEFTLRLGF
jgi:hypothetical protein